MLLQNQGSDTGNMRSRHGSTRHPRIGDIIIALVHRVIHIYRIGGEYRYTRSYQVRLDIICYGHRAPRAEISQQITLRHGVDHIRKADVRLSHLLQALAFRLLDLEGRNIP
ncbi:hypothetical protein D3C75_941460 [compost metagenome]